MAKSETVSVRLSKNEKAKIKKCFKKHNIESMNGFFRAAAGITISFIDVLWPVIISKGYASKGEAALNNLPDEFWGKIERDLQKALAETDEFIEERSAGRPSNPKNKRGRPKNTGY